jgi:hypothetical protein
MARRKALLILAAALFAGWMVYLLQLALTHRNAVVVCGPQLLVTDVIVVAEIDRPDSDSIQAVTVSSNAKGYNGPPPEKGKSIRLRNLAGCDGIQPGIRKYLVPLTADGAGGFEVATIPRSPGHGLGPPRIYPDTNDTREQIKRLVPELSIP